MPVFTGRAHRASYAPWSVARRSLPGSGSPPAPPLPSPLLILASSQQPKAQREHGATQFSNKGCSCWLSPVWSFLQQIGECAEADSGAKIRQQANGSPGGALWASSYRNTVEHKSLQAPSPCTCFNSLCFVLFRLSPTCPMSSPARGCCREWTPSSRTRYCLCRAPLHLFHVHTSQNEIMSGFNSCHPQLWLASPGPYRFSKPASSAAAD